MIGAKAAGHHVYLLTSSQLEKSPWPWDSLDDIFYMVEDKHGLWNHDHLIAGLSHKMRTLKFDIFVALDDFDVEHVAYLREYFRIPGMGETTARYFRDKLAMRIKAQSEGITVPAFTPLFNDAEIHEFTQRVPAPWIVKPRMQASAAGLKKIYSTEELWKHLNYLGHSRHEYLMEKFAPGDVYHVDALTSNGKVQFASVSGYLDTPFEVAHGGGIFRSVTLDKDSDDYKELQKLNEQVMKAFGMQYSASHSEFIKGKEDGKYYFLETASRVGGAHIAEMVEFATGINLWKEWAKIEIDANLNKPYKLPKVKEKHGGIIVSLSRFKDPDTSVFNDKEIAWRLKKEYHIGLILHAKERNRILSLLDDYTERVKKDFHASAPAKEKLVGETPHDVSHGEYEDNDWAGKE
jgi:D-alanine-D-alanine ligase-like ATP-grasp enzyme